MMDNQTAKSIDRSLKAIATSLQKIEKNTSPTIVVPDSEESTQSITGESSKPTLRDTLLLKNRTEVMRDIGR